MEWKLTAGERQVREAERRTVDVLAGGGVDGEAAAPGGGGVEAVLHACGVLHCADAVGGWWGFGGWRSRSSWLDYPPIRQPGFVVGLRHKEMCV